MYSVNKIDMINESSWLINQIDENIDIIKITTSIIMHSMAIAGNHFFILMRPLAMITINAANII